MADTSPSAPPSLFVAVGEQGQRIASSDGINWKSPQLGKEGEIYRAVRFGNGRYVAVGTFGGENIVAYSTDGASWLSGKKLVLSGGFLRALAYGNDSFIAFGGDPGSAGDSKPFLVTSTDGTSWSSVVQIGGKNIIRRAAFGNGLFVAVGDRGRRSASKDGHQWNDAPAVRAIDTLIDIAFGKDLFVGCGLHGLRMTSRDGLAWSPRIPGEEGEHLNSIVFTGDRFVAVGVGASYFSPDGITWERKPNKDAPLTVAYGNSVFVGINWKGRILHSTDALAWRQVYKSDFNFEAVTFGSA